VFKGPGKDFGSQKELNREIEFLRLKDFARKDTTGTTYDKVHAPGYSPRLSGFAVLIPYHFTGLYSRTLASAEHPNSLLSRTVCLEVSSITNQDRSHMLGRRGKLKRIHARYMWERPHSI
jgi:hypothetical protein